ncbi:hypothetical protein, partial [Bartonella bovis]|uniref:hypothetical protein n=1 Tax=Bartonella bovis TaxID=155194 RepID=UPI001304BAF1
GVEATAGNLTINGHSRIEFTGSGHGVKVGSGVESARLTSVTITGTSGQGKGVEVSMGSSKTMTMTDVRISKVEKA